MQIPNSPEMALFSYILESTNSICYLNLWCGPRTDTGSLLQIFQEKTYLVGVECKRAAGNSFSIEESLKELEQLADTAGLMVLGSTYQK